MRALGGTESVLGTGSSNMTWKSPLNDSAIEHRIIPMYETNGVEGISSRIAPGAKELNFGELSYGRLVCTK